MDCFTLSCAHARVQEYPQSSSKLLMFLAVPALTTDYNTSLKSKTRSSQKSIPISESPSGRSGENKVEGILQLVLRQSYLSGNSHLPLQKCQFFRPGTAKSPTGTACCLKGFPLHLFKMSFLATHSFFHDYFIMLELGP